MVVEDNEALSEKEGRPVRVTTGVLDPVRDTLEETDTEEEELCEEEVVMDAIGVLVTPLVFEALGVGVTIAVGLSESVGMED